MSTPVRILGFLATLAVVFGLAAGVGRAVGPVAEPAPEHDPDASHGEAEPAAAPEIPGGLMVSQDGYSFRLGERTVPAGEDARIDFTIEGSDGRPVTSYDVEHDQRLHLIAVRRDFAGFQHVHPTMAADGTWTTRLDLEPGQWRLFADFKATGADGLTLGADLHVPGRFEPAPAAGDQRTAQVDGYTVTLDGDLSAGKDARLTLIVSKDGRPVTDLEPYLGAYGHLVALREGDLAYLHVHPDGEPGDGTTRPGPEVVFYAAVPSTGSYRLFLDFQHDGVVRTAAFTLSTAGHGQPQPAGDQHAPEGEEDGHGH